MTWEWSPEGRVRWELESLPGREWDFARALGLGSCQSRWRSHSRVGDLGAWANWGQNCYVLGAGPH